MRVFAEPVEFVWDKGNINKSWVKHKVSNEGAEEVFSDEKRKIFKDKLHSGKEQRFRVVGVTADGRLLLVVFTVRRRKVRIISARDINRKEKYLYEKEAGTAKI